MKVPQVSPVLGLLVLLAAVAKSASQPLPQTTPVCCCAAESQLDINPKPCSLCIAPWTLSPTLRGPAQPWFRGVQLLFLLLCSLAACLSLCQCPPRLVVAYFSRQAVRLQHFITKRCRLRGRHPRRSQGPRQRKTLQELPPLALPPRCPQTGSAWRSPQPSTQRSSSRWSHWRHQVLVWQLLCWVHSQVPAWGDS